MQYKTGDVVYIVLTEDQDTLLVRRVVIRKAKGDVIGYAESIKETLIFYTTKLDRIFDNPQDAVTKALELKLW